ncbi:MAG: hypothetical protein LC775_05580, partial [Acidobacteria bacterium]|nr:hypothetical protein [Acidobacteriota bacterium]
MAAIEGCLPNNKPIEVRAVDWILGTVASNLRVSVIAGKPSNAVASNALAASRFARRDACSACRT